MREGLTDPDPNSLNQEESSSGLCCFKTRKTAQDARFADDGSRRLTTKELDLLGNRKAKQQAKELHQASLTAARDAAREGNRHLPDEPELGDSFALPQQSERSAELVWTDVGEPRGGSPKGPRGRGAHEALTAQINCVLSSRAAQIRGLGLLAGKADEA